MEVVDTPGCWHVARPAEASAEAGGSRSTWPSECARLPALSGKGCSIPLAALGVLYVSSRKGGRAPPATESPSRVGGRVAWGDSRLQGSVASSSRTTTRRERRSNVAPLYLHRRPGGRLAGTWLGTFGFRQDRRFCWLVGLTQTTLVSPPWRHIAVDRPDHHVGRHIARPLKWRRAARRRALRHGCLGTPVRTFPLSGSRSGAAK